MTRTINDRPTCRRGGSRTPRPVVWLLGLLTSVCCLLLASPARADSPAAAVRRLVDALRANDRAAYLDALSEQFDYNGARRTDLDPFGLSGIVSAELYSQIVQLQSVGPGVATALVDLQFLGQVNLEELGSGMPPVAGTRRLWLELRRQPDQTWRVSALRTVHRRFVSGGWPAGEDVGLTDVRVNGRSSTRLRPGARFIVQGTSRRGDGMIVGIAAEGVGFHLQQKENEPWSVELKAPDRPGRYVVAATLLAEREISGAFAVFWEDITVPVIVE